MRTIFDFKKGDRVYLKTLQGIFNAEIVRQADSSAPVDGNGLSTARVEYKWVNANGKKSTAKEWSKTRHENLFIRSVTELSQVAAFSTSTTWKTTKF
jgi:hypothetical protein